MKYSLIHIHSHHPHPLLSDIFHLLITNSQRRQQLEEEKLFRQDRLITTDLTIDKFNERAQKYINHSYKQQINNQ